MDRGGYALDGIRRLALAGGLALVMAAPAAAEEATPARLLFGKVDAPSDTPAEVLGGYAKGCLSGAEQLADVGPGFQTMRPSRNRAWGHPQLVRFVKTLAADVVGEGHAPLLVGDLAQPRGGPMLSGHASHQIGLDVDIWFRPAPPAPLSEADREEWSAYSVVASAHKAPWVNDMFTARERRVVELAARDRRTERIFVAAPIKKALCDAAPEEDRAWLRKVRPWFGHKDHLHVRLACPLGEDGCTAQTPPPAGDGCGAELESWLKPPPPSKPKPPGAKPKPPKRKREITLSDLPEACAAVLAATPRIE